MGENSDTGEVKFASGKKNLSSGSNTDPLSLSYICTIVFLFLPGVELGGGVCETVQG